MIDLSPLTNEPPVAETYTFDDKRNALRNSFQNVISGALMQIQPQMQQQQQSPIAPANKEGGI